MALLIDADVEAFKAAATHQEITVWDEDTTSISTDIDGAKRAMWTAIKGYMEIFQTDDVEIILSDDTNFRYEVLPTYKGNRKDKARPVLLPELRQHLRDELGAWSLHNLEGDDALGILSTKEPGEHTIISIDKDMQTIPGMLYNPMAEAKEEGTGLIKITVKHALMYHLMQTLTGDTVDGYKGCPGIGPVNARKAMEPLVYDYTYLTGMKFKDDPAAWVAFMWEKGVMPLYEKKGLTEDDAIVQATVAHILWNKDYNQETGEITPWHPQLALS